MTRTLFGSLIGTARCENCGARSALRGNAIWSGFVGMIGIPIVFIAASPVFLILELLSPITPLLAIGVGLMLWLFILEIAGIRLRGLEVVEAGTQDFD